MTKRPISLPLEQQRELTLRPWERLGGLSCWLRSRGCRGFERNYLVLKSLFALVPAGGGCTWACV